MFNAILVIIGTIIGAGFASGKEIFTFFNSYGYYGFLGLLISEVIIGFVIYKAFYIIINYNIKSYSEFVGKTITKSSFVNNVVCNIINIFLLISFIVMVAGFSAFFAQELNIPYIFGATLIALLCFLTFLCNIKGIVKINTYFIPFLIFMIIILGLKNVKCFTNSEFISNSSTINWFVSALLYASYNLIIVFPILISLKDYVHSIKGAKIVSLCVTLFLLLMAIILFFLMEYYFHDVQFLELPTVYISSQLGGLYKYSCGFVILGAIFTTAISSGYGFLNNFSNRKTYTFMAVIICLLSIVLSNIGFSTLLNMLYPILGLLRFYTNYVISV